jgi:hypothetical protein
MVSPGVDADEKIAIMRPEIPESQAKAQLLRSPILRFKMMQVAL